MGTKSSIYVPPASFTGATWWKRAKL
ncbi:hypothetical protein EYZ11_011631 [Aspergillus tanneri]|uniref:Uncharacterized protein n=1 Tax=Aspergillus tanneri TaxID=1220188 RepID=A0A4S3J7M6_9EURO|nr:hypothetical protein EYZ11_011631 [Aspergillus tanneri]